MTQRLAMISILIPGGLHRGRRSKVQTDDQNKTAQADFVHLAHTGYFCQGLPQSGMLDESENYMDRRAGLMLFCTI